MLYTLAEMDSMWNKVCCGQKHALNPETVEVLSKMRATTNKIDEIKQWYIGVNGEPSMIIPTIIDPKLRTESLQYVLKVRNTGMVFRTFKSLRTNAIITLHPFNVVMEEIAIWVDPKSGEGYSGGSSIANRSRVDTALTTTLSSEAYAAIVLYILIHYQHMNQLGEGRQVMDPDYAKKFRYVIWYDFCKWFFRLWKDKVLNHLLIAEFKNVSKFKVITILYDAKNIILTFRPNICIRIYNYLLKSIQESLALQNWQNMDSPQSRQRKLRVK